jgi:hypothetical protein
MYDDPDNLTGAILTFLDLPPSEVFRKTLDTHVRFANQRKPRKVPGKFADLYSGTDRKDARALRKEARLRLIDLLDTPHSADGPAK